MVMRGVIMREYFGTRSLGKLLGITMGFASIGGIIGPTIAGWSYDITGHYRFIWMTFFIIMVISVGLSMKIKPAKAPLFSVKL
jgi:MFS family permease